MGECGGSETHLLHHRSRFSSPPICIKCKERSSQILANQTEALCAACLHASLLSKFKTAVNNHGLITPSDKVLLAFSGGPASRVALEFLINIQQKAQRDAMNCRDGIISVFGLGVAFVDEAAVLPISPSDRLRIVQEIRSMISSENQELFVVPIESVYSSEELGLLGELDHEERRNTNRLCKLESLLQNVEDATGKEDLLEHLRMQVLQKVAVEHGYTKLVLGLCTSRIAARVIAATAKGQGFSLPADVQYCDARWPVPVVLPLRDCVAKELIFFCHFNHLKTVFIQSHLTLTMPQQSINSLATAFVLLLQEENPSRERTIVRTAGKLKPFHFNSLTDSKSNVDSRRRGCSIETFNTTILTEEPGPELFCPFCLAPLNEREIFDIETVDVLDGVHPVNSLPEVMGNFADHNHLVDPTSVLPLSALMKMCCPSCRFQFLGGKKADQMLELLPHMIKRRLLQHPRSNRSWMRSQISDLLISNDELDK